MIKKKTIKYLENGEYHDATVKDVGVIEELKTESKDNLVEAINEIFLGGGKGFSDLQQKVDESTQAAQNAQQATDNLQQAANNLQQRLEEVANSGLSDEEARKIINQAVEDAKRAQAEALQAYKEAQKELDDSMAQFMEEQKAINKELEQAKTDIQGDIDQKNAEIEQINSVIESTKSDLTATSARLASVRNDLTNAQMDWGKVRTEITNINGKLASKMSNTDFDEYKERIERNETEVTQTKNELQSKATKQDLDVLTGTVTTQGSSITQLAGKIEQKVSKDTLANDIDDFQVKKANIFTGTREFMGWEFSDKALGRVNDDIYNHAKVAELHNGSNLSITVNGLEVGKTYSVSIFAKASANSNTSGVKVTVDNGKSYSGLMKTVYTPHDTKVATNWQRYYATIVASATTMKFVFDRSGMTSDITLYLNRPKLEVGETVYAWEDNAQDIYKRVEHTEAQFDVYNDQISGIVKRQTETDKKIENVSSTFTQRADGIEANAKKYTNDKVTGLTEEFSGRLKATSQELSTEYEKQTNAKIGALSDGGSNLILNSSFLVTDNNGNATLENWRDTSSKISLTKPNGLDGTWIKVNRATTGTALGARSNYFPAKQGKLVVGVDVALDGTGNISPYVLRIEYYDVSNNRVNYEDITLQKLGLSASQITKSGSNFRYARGVYKTSNDRSDVAKACIVVPETITGYDMYLTNFFAKFSDVNDGTYEVNPLDQQASLIKQRTKIEQDSEKINLLNTQTEKLGNDIKATNTSIGVLKGEINLKASQSTVNDLTNRVSKNEADIRVFPDKIKSEVREVSKKVDGVNDKVDGIQIGGGKNLVRGTSSDWTGVGRDEFNGSNNQTHIIGYAYLDQLKVGDSVTVTCNYQYSGVTNANAEVQIQGWGNVDEWGPGQFPRQTPFAMQTGNDLYKGSINYTFKLTADMVKNRYWQLAWRFNYVNQGAWFQWVFFKMEKGTTATPWSPAPEDLNDSIEATKSIATQTKDGFDRLTQKTGYNASTGEFSKITTQINEGIKGISSEVKSVSNKVDSVNGRIDSLNVGGRNLLYKTKDIDVNNKNWYQKGNNVYYEERYNKKAIHAWGDWSTYVSNQTIHLEANTDYTVSAYLMSYQKGTGSGIQFGVYAKNTADNQTFTVGVLQNTKGNLSNTEWRRFSSVYHNDTAKDITDFRIEASGDWSTVSGNVWIAEIKLETGNIATDYTPAPEDLQDGIDIATTKATQTDTKFERMISQIQYNDSTGEIGKYEHKITELANGTQEKISAIRLDSDKKLQSATQTLTNKIGDLESTIRTNTTNIGQYRQEMTNSAKELSTKFTSVQTNLTGVSNKVNSVNGRIDSVNGRVDSVNGRIDSLNVGGRNLLYKTKDIDVNNKNWYQKGNNVYYEERYNKKAIHAWGDWSTYVSNQTIHLEANTDYTVSAYLMSYQKGTGSGIQFGVYAKNTADNQTFTVGVLQNTKGNLSNTEWRRFSSVYHNDTAKDITDFRIEASGDWSTVSGNVWIAEIKLETGNIATDYTPAPEDIDNKIEVLSGKITANSNEFSTVYSKITNAKNDAINAIKGDSQWQSMGKIVTNAAFLQTADGFAQEVVRTTTPIVNGGGKNLARGTSDSWTGVYTKEFDGSTNFTKQVADVYLGDLNVGDKVTVQITYQYSGVTSNNAKCWLQGYGDVTVWGRGQFYGTPTTINMETGTDLKSGSKKYTFTIDSEMKKNRFWRVAYRFDNVNKGAWFQWLKFKVERGSVATPWSPAPEDLATKLQLNDISSRTQFLQDDEKFLLRVTQSGGATKADVNSTNSKIGNLQGQITDNANKFNTVYTKVDVDNKVNGANSKIGDLSTRVKNTEVAITSGGVTINGNTKINGTLNAKGMVLDDKTGSKLEFNSSGLDISYSQNREQYFTFGGNGLDFWRMSRDEAMDDYPDHHKPGYVHLGSMLALDNEYTKSVNRPDQQHTNTPSNNNGIGFVIDVTGGADNFAILQKGAEYRKGEKWGRINFNETVNNSHFPIWEINATGYGSHAWLQSGYNRGRGIFNYSNLYFYTDPVIGTEHDPDGKDYFPIERIGLVGNDGWGGLAVWADNKNVVSIRTNDEYPVVANGLIISKHTGDNDGVYIGGDGRQWVNLINTRNVRADVSSKDGRHYSNHLGSMFLYELRYGALTHTSQLSRKTDVSPIDINDLSSKLLSIDLFKYKYKSQKENEKYRYGGIIDDINEVKQYNLPQEFISTSGEGIDDSNLITGLIATAKIQAKEIEKLNFRILELERGKING